MCDNWSFVLLTSGSLTVIWISKGGRLGRTRHPIRGSWELAFPSFLQAGWIPPSLPFLLSLYLVLTYGWEESGISHRSLWCTGVK